MKLCTSCMHFRSGDECAKDMHTNPVNGRPIYGFAYTNRMTPTRCGQDAKWFEEIDHGALDDLSTIPFGR
jgi:hypothetical protein